MRLESFISWRYLVTKRKEKFISLISIISIAGIAIGVTALIVVIAVMSGFDNDLREKIVGNYSHITVSGYKALDSASAQLILKEAKSLNHVIDASAYVQGQVLVKEGDKFFASALRGIDPQSGNTVTKLKDYLVSGNLSALQSNTVIIGRELAGYLGLSVGDEIQVFSAQEKEFKLTICGIFSSGMYDYDMNLMFTDIKTGQVVLGLDQGLSAVAVKLDDLYRADEVKEALIRKIGFTYVARTWMEANQNFFAALKLEKLVMFIILTLIILVAAFNIISTLIVMVVEKTKDIGILRSIGMSASQIRALFTLHGCLIGIIGVVFGVAGGVGTCLLLKKYQFIKLPQDIYYIDRLPVALQLWPDLILIVGCALSIVLAATIYPARKASQLKPVDALRYE